MFFVLSKILFFLIQPLNWVTCLLLAGLMVRHPRGRGRLTAAGTVLLVLLTNPFLLNVALRMWEPDLVPVESVEGAFDVGIVLGGYGRIIEEHRDRVHFGSDPNRLTNAIELFKAGKIDRILVSGGSPEVVGGKLTNLDEVRKFLEAVGVPPGSILAEDRSRNTHENARYSAEMLGDRLPGARCLLITSAIHMPRAAACFRKEGMEVTTFPTDTRVEDLSLRKPWRLIIPAPQGFREWENLVREWVGMLVYKVQGFA